MSETKPIVLLTHPLPDDWIGDALNNFSVIIGKKENRGIDQNLKKYLPDVEGILCLLDDPIPEDIIKAAPKLKVISNMAVGTDNIDLNTCTRMGIPVGHTPGVLTEGTADLTVALLLAVARQLPLASQDARDGSWSNWNPTGWLGVDLNGATVGIVGMGKIGTAVAERIRAFRSQILFTNRSPLPEKEQNLSAKQVPLELLLKTSDFICLHVPLTNETENMIDENAFEMMKDSAILINAARGKVVNTNALVKALQDGQIRAAGLDVTDPEPLPPDHPLYHLENCLITPHIGSATENTRRIMAEIAIQNLIAGINGQTLLFQANP